MADLSDSIPTDLFVPRFSTVKETIVASCWESLQANQPKDVPGICMFIWDEMVHRKVAKEPFKIAPIINNGFKGISTFIEKELKEPPVTDAFAVSYFNEIDPKNSFVDVSLVQCWPNDIHIADVEFSDNRSPVHTGKFVKNSIFRNYHGLHVFGAFLDRLKMVARERNVQRISLLVSHPDLYEVFSRHGFKVSDTVMAQATFKTVGKGFSMVVSAD